MTSRFASVGLMLCLGLSPMTAAAQELSAKELKKAVKQADKAFAAGSYDQAGKLYDQILASTSGTDARRGDALYSVAMIQLSSGDQAVAKQHLEQLAAFTNHPQRLEIAALSGLFSGLDSAQAESARRATELAALEEKIAAYQAEQEQAAAEAEEAAGESEAVGDRVRSLESQLRRKRTEIAECKAELEEKEQALQKLRDTLVGGS